MMGMISLIMSAPLVGLGDGEGELLTVGEIEGVGEIDGVGEIEGDGEGETVGVGV